MVIEYFFLSRDFPYIFFHEFHVSSVSAASDDWSLHYSHRIFVYNSETIFYLAKCNKTIILYISNYIISKKFHFPILYYIIVANAAELKISLKI